MTGTRLVAGVLLSLVLSSCAYQPQVIRLNPTTPKVDASTGSLIVGREVVLTASDTRDSKEIGRRSNGFTRHAAPITTDSDVVALLQEQMGNILKGKGYRLMEAGTKDVSTVEIQLKELSYTSFLDNGNKKVKVQVVLETVIKNGLKSYRTTFQSNQVRPIVLQPVAKSNEEWINETLSDTLQQIASDPKIFTYLD